jgi:hypothetical protein
LANEVGALQFLPGNFGAVAASGGEVSHEAQTMFAVMALMPDSQLALLTGWGEAQSLGDCAPGLPENASVTSINRLQMLLNGETYWVANWQGPGAWGTGLFQRDPGPWGSVELLMNTGDRVCDGELRSLRQFRVAEDRTLAQVVDLRTPQGDRTALLVGGECPYSVGQPLPASTECPTQFWFFDVNSSGHVLFGAITDRSAQRNAVFVLDGNVVMREGDVVDGVYLQPPYAEPNQVRLDDRGRAVTLWANVASSTFTIFFTPDIERFSDTRKLVSENTPLDFDGDGDTDATLYRFRFFPYSGPTISLGETGIYIAVWLTYPGSSEAVAAVIFYPF